MVAYSDALRDSLFDLIYKDAFNDLPEEVTLSSGKKTQYYFDLKQVTGHPRGINEVAKALYGLIVGLDEKIKSVGGLESGSISIATAISALSHNANPDNSLTSFYVRKAAKSHGLGKQIEGIARTPAVIVDDVVTTGDSALRAVKALKDGGIDAKYLICIVYRDSPEKKREFEDKNGIKLVNLFFESDFIKQHKHNEPIEA